MKSINLKLHSWPPAGSILVLLLLLVLFASQPWGKKTAMNSYNLLVLSGLIYVIHDIVKGQFINILKLKPVLYSIAFFIVALISWAASSLENIDFKDLKPYLSFITAPLFIYAVQASKINKKGLAVVILATCVSFGVYAISAKLSGYRWRLPGVENPVGFGNAAMLFAITAIFIANKIEKKWLAVTLLIASCMAFIAVLGSGTRGSFLPIVFLIFYLIMSIKTLPNLSKVIIIAIALISSSYWVSTTPHFKRTIANFEKYADGNTRSSLGHRIHLWQKATCLAAEHPVLGVGTGAFDEVQQQKTTTRCDLSDLATSAYQAHSVYFQTLATMGFIGLLALLAYFLSYIRWAYATNNELKTAITAAVITMMGYGLTVDFFFTNFLSIRHVAILGLLLGVALTLNKQESAK